VSSPSQFHNSCRPAGLSFCRKVKPDGVLHVAVDSRIHQLYKRAIERPLDDNAAWQLAGAYARIGANNEALAWINTAIVLAPLGDYFCIKGKILSQMNTFSEAAECYECAIKLGTPMSNASAFLASIYAREPERRATAVSLILAVIRHNPRNVFPYVIMAGCLADRTLTEMIAASESILTGVYNKSALYCGIAESLCLRGRFEEAAESADFVLRHDPKCSYAWFMRGVIALRGFHDPDAALYYHMQAAALDHVWIEAVIGDLLYLGQYENAREQFLSTRAEYRSFLSESDTGSATGSRRPALGGKTILARATMGFGDAILHTRFASLASKNGASVVIQCPRAIRSLFKTSPGVAGVIPHEEEPGIVDLEINLEHLGFIYPLAAKGAGLYVPCFFPRPDLIEKWRSRLPSSEQLRIGIAWHGGPSWQDEPHRRRSIPLACFESLFQIPNTTWVSLQKGQGIEELQAHADIHCVVDIGIGSETADFADTAAAIAGLDLVISVDTSIAHLAGSMGKPTFVLLPYTSFWVWSLQGQHTVWYPATTLFRQQTPGEWTSPMEQIRDRVSELARAHSRLNNLTEEKTRQPAFSAFHAD